MISHIFDITSQQTIINLQKTFGINEKKNIFNPNMCPKSIGIEIEVKFKYLFPDLHTKYFSDINKYYSLPPEQKNIISKEISIAEKDILPLYQKTIQCGIPAGKDKYWEFAFTPVYDTNLLLYQIDILEQIRLIPLGNHSLHINIGDVHVDKKAYIMTSALQLLYVTKERLVNGIRDCNYPVAWARKGRAGIRQKNSIDLVNSDSGYEIRTLEYNGNLETLRKIFQFISFFIDNNNCREYNELALHIGNLLKKYNLPNKNWENPVVNPAVWNNYINNFNAMAQDFKDIALIKPFV